MTEEYGWSRSISTIATMGDCFCLSDEDSCGLKNGFTHVALILSVVDLRLSLGLMSLVCSSPNMPKRGGTWCGRSRRCPHLHQHQASELSHLVVGVAGLFTRFVGVKEKWYLSHFYIGFCVCDYHNSVD
jgi:hypothetical protein